METTATPETPTETAPLAVVEPMPQQFAVVVKQTGIATVTAETLFASYRPFFTEVNRLLEEAKSVNVTDATEVTMIKQARTLRLALRKQRTDADKIREQLKAESLRTGSAVQGMFNVLKLMTEPVEEKLEKMENFAAIKEKERLDSRKAKRVEALKPYGVDSTFFDLVNMPDPAFEKLLESSRVAFEREAEAKKKAIAEAAAKEKADKEERDRIAAENERLKKEAADREAAAAKEKERLELEKKAADERAAAAEKQRLADIAAKEKEAKERTEKALEEQRKANAEAMRLEKERRDREDKQRDLEAAAAKKKADAAAAAAKKQREELAAQAAESKRRADELEAKAATEKAHAEELRAQEEKRAKAAAAAPDKEKLVAYAAALRSLPIPELATPAGKTAVTAIWDQREKLAAWIEQKADKI